MSDRKTLKRSLTLGIMLAGFSSAVMAHEFWLEPQQYQVEPGQEARVDIRIGQNFNGRVYPFIQRQSEAFFWVEDGQRIEAESMTGDKPAARRTLNQPGYTYLAYQSGAFDLRFTDAEELLDYLKTEGLDEALAYYQQPQNAPENVTETYYRHAKALIGTPGAEERPWMVKPLGLRIEIVPEAGFTDCAQHSFFTVLVDGAPREGMLVRRFQGDHKAIYESRTDDQGQVRFPPGEGPYLISSVYLEAGQDNPRALGKDWVSDWGSLTYNCIQ